MQKTQQYHYRAPLGVSKKDAVEYWQIMTDPGRGGVGGGGLKISGNLTKSIAIIHHPLKSVEIGRNPSVEIR